MIAIIDNGTGAEAIANFVRIPREIIKPNEAVKSKASAFILSDGDVKHQKTNIELIKKTGRPLLAIGAGCAFLGAAYGAKYKEVKQDKMDRVRIEHPCPLTLDLKKMFTVMQTCRHILTDLPDAFHVVASSSKNEYKVISENDKPFFGVHFNPELGSDGLKIIDNFVKFVEVWEKYHGEKKY
jgi:GMP synthase-like glutamine amidotransferase